jgi:hypothetical protein
MRKFYKPLIVALTLAFPLAANAQSQELTADQVYSLEHPAPVILPSSVKNKMQSLTITEDKIHSLQNPSAVAPGQPALQNAPTLSEASPVSCDSLTTTYSAGNGNSGIMFNIKGVQNTAITGFHVSIDAITQTYIKLYYRKGTYLGNETTPSSWTFIDSVEVTGAGTGVPVYVPINTSIIVPAGMKYGFYITTNDPGVILDYTDGTNEDSVYVANSYIEVREGRGMSYPFMLSGVPRVFNGSVHFCPEVAVQCDTINTTYVAGNGQDGAMFDVTAVQDITLDRLYASVDGEGWMKIYYKNGTYSGFETNPSAWTLLDSAYVSPITTMIPTLINVYLNLPVTSGQTVGLYVTGTQTGASVDYTNGTAEGNVFASDSYIEIKEGRGVEYPFGNNYVPRIFNTTIDYCPGVITGIEGENDLSSNLYPNPFSTSATLELGTGINLDNAVLNIYDVLGKQVKSITGISNNTVQIEKGDLPAGVYIYRLGDETGMLATGRYVIE